jgi:hypothetical protein
MGIQMQRDVLHIAAATLALASWFAANTSARAQPTASASVPSAEEVKFFESQVRPVLVARCFQCHGSKQQKGELRLDSLEGVLAGGESGPAIVPKSPQASMLIQSINHESTKMPPDGKLPEEQIAALTRWVEMGAPWPGSDPSRIVRSKKREQRISDDDRAHWAYQPLRKEAASGVQRSDSNPIDHFIQSRLRAEGLSPAPPADRTTLIRRATFDLIGLPPTPAEVAAFENDPAPDAYNRLLDGLLDSPRYGEHWARHWLDLVRYAESDGYKQDGFREDAWRYRDYVIRAFNDDKPYSQFIVEQLAGDEVDPQNADALIATGYLRHGIYEYNQVDVRRQHADILNEITDVAADVFLAMGMGCARCHDHKFDPILQTDYYRLQAFFAPLVWRDDLDIATPNQRKEHEKKLSEWERATAEIRKQIDDLERTLGPLTHADRIKRFPPDVQDILNARAEDRTPYEEQIYQLAARQTMPFERGKPSKEVKQQLDELKKKLATFQDRKPAPLAVAIGARDVGQIAPPTTIPNKTSPPLEPGFPEVLGGETPKIEPLPTAPNSTGRRAALARWIASPNNPLTARVMVNRLWQYHFGNGLATSSSDFGQLGERPTHEQLLDWLAGEFVNRGWSVKQMHRLIMSSATYQQSSHHPKPTVASTQDPQNKLLWRQNCRRLEAEQVRDAALAVAGELDLQMSGPSVVATKPRRTIYTKMIRNTRDPLLDVFDVPDGYLSVAQRNTTTTPSQALLMTNGDWMLARSKSLAGRLESMSNDSVVRQAYQLIYSRRPTEEEVAAGMEFFQSQRNRLDRQTVFGHSSLVQRMPQRDGNAAVIDPNLPQTILSVADSAKLPSGDFTIEAHVLLHSIAADSAMRTIAAQWDGNSKNRGWALGVAGKKSAATPGNLILRISDESSRDQTPKLCDSEITLNVNCPYYAAAVVDAADGKTAAVTFYVKDLSDNDAPLLVKRVEGSLPAVDGIGENFTMGGLGAEKTRSWDGLIDDVRFSAAALAESQLLWQNGSAGEMCIGHWRFEETPGFDKDSSGNQRHIVGSNAATDKTKNEDRRAVLIDFCHVLLNSSEFIYVD